MTARKLRLRDCDPAWVMRFDTFTICGLSFNCPEGHAGCWHRIPFTGADVVWHRTGDTFETLTIMPSIRRLPRYASREAALADGIKPEHVTPALLCAFHGFISGGRIEFCDDSR